MVYLQLIIQYAFSHENLCSFSTLVLNGIVYNRGGQSAARGPHAVLQRFSAPLCQILDALLSYLWSIYVWNYPKWTSIMWSLWKKKSKKKFFGPQYNIFMKFGPSEKKSGHPWYIRCVESNMKKYALKL